MKRFACHKLFITPQLVYPQSVVEVDAAGYFQNHFVLSQEVRGTAWIGGVCFLSPHLSLATLSAQAAWEQFCSHAACTDKEKPLYVWHLVPFDFVNNCCTNQTRLQQLL